MLHGVLKTIKFLSSVQKLAISRQSAELNILDVNICKHCDVFTNSILKFMRPEPNQVYNTEGLKLFTRMPVRLSHLTDHKFRYNFQDCLEPSCSCSQEIETTTFTALLHGARQTFFEKNKQY